MAEIIDEFIESERRSAPPLPGPPPPPAELLRQANRENCGMLSHNLVPPSQPRLVARGTGHKVSRSSRHAPPPPQCHDMDVRVIMQNWKASLEYNMLQFDLNAFNISWIVKKNCCHLLNINMAAESWYCLSQESQTSLNSGAASWLLSHIRSTSWLNSSVTQTLPLVFLTDSSCLLVLNNYQQ